jgi:peptide-methionine (S)-S-oxide reductase
MPGSPPMMTDAGVVDRRRARRSSGHFCRALRRTPKADLPRIAARHARAGARAIKGEDEAASVRRISDGRRYERQEVAMEKVGFGGGCHWCTEGVFQALKGVIQVDQGFIRSEPPSDSWAEGVIVTFDPTVIGLATLAEVHLGTHSANERYSPGGRYRSAIYVCAATQREDAVRTIARSATVTNAPARTLVLPLLGFRASEPRYQDYYRTDPDRPFCRRYIDPKLDYLRRHFADITRAGKAARET